MGRLMAIDYGDARIGIALTDPLKIIASGYKTVENSPDSLEQICSICEDKDVEAIVMGIPFDQTGGIGPAAEKAITFGNRLKKFLQKTGKPLPFFEQDERYTTRIAHTAMKAAGVRSKKKKKVVDQIAAAAILKDFMESKYQTPFKRESP